jgi:hypothetical protein
MRMKHRTAIYVVLIVIGLIVLAFPAPRTIRRPNVQPSRITGVNTLRSVSLTLTNVSALRSAQPGTDE